eukprot:1324144-Prymnesium_polylepis.2
MLAWAARSGGGGTCRTRDDKRLFAGGALGAFEFGFRPRAHSTAPLRNQPAAEVEPRAATGDAPHDPTAGRRSRAGGPTMLC